MLGIPSGLSPTGAACLLVGILVVALLAWWKRRSLPADAVGRAAAGCLLFTLAFTPFLTWRIVEDLRLTTSMTAYDRNAAGPVQAFLQPYLLDPVRAIIPPSATYATITGPGVKYPTATEALPALAMTTLFPRKGVFDPKQADWVIAWGTPLRGAVPVDRVVVARPAQGGYPAVVVGRVRR
jgi:hypothetical protein